MRMSKKLVFGILGSVLLLTGLGVYIAVGSLDRPNEGVSSSETASESEDGEGSEAVTGEEGDGGESPDVAGSINPFEAKVKTPLSENLVQQYIHAMSHQKVQAKEKWSFFKITDERIDFLFNQLEINKYEHENLYESILKSWKEGDFSEADIHHNRVWKLQEGTIGEATGVLSPEAEETYLQKQNKESR
jgi:Family of unknown function (DUF6241)